MPDGQPRALARFQPGYVSGGAGEGQRTVKLITNLAGEPVRFTINEDLSSIVTTGSLLILNANFSEVGETIPGVYSSSDVVNVEEDMAKWNTVYEGATVEPNQLVDVTEIVGSFSTNVVDGVTTYSGVGDGQTCTTHWRVVSFSVYEDDKGVPYCDVALESLVAVLLEKTMGDYISNLPPPETVITDGSAGETVTDSEGNVISTDSTVEAIQNTEACMFADEDFIDGVRKSYLDDATVDGYAYKEETENIMVIKEFTDADAWVGELTSMLGSEVSGTIADLTLWPCYRVYRAGEEVWKCIDEMLALNRTVARFKRDLTLVQWSVDQEGFGDTVDIGDYGKGLKASYTKDNVYSNVEVKGFVGTIGPDGLWIPWEASEKSAQCFSPAANNILNGKKRQLPSIVIPADYLLQSITSINNWGVRELYKSALQSRGISVESDSIPLNVEVGMKITGSSALFGSVSALVTSFSRTTDAQALTSTTSITGGSVGMAPVEGDSWT